jgi:hypothetical protein
VFVEGHRGIALYVYPAKTPPRTHQLQQPLAQETSNTSALVRMGQLDLTLDWCGRSARDGERSCAHIHIEKMYMYLAAPGFLLY